MSCMIIWDNFLVWVRFNKTNSHTSSTAHMSFLNLQNPPVDLSYCTPMPDQRRRQRTSTMRIQHSSMLLWSLLAVAGAFHLPVSPSVRAAHLSNPGSATTQGRTSTSKSTFGYASSTSITTATTALPMLGVTYPSFDEMIAGGERYEMVPLPDSMCTTTLWGWQSLRIHHRRAAFRAVLRGERLVVIASVRGTQSQRIVQEVWVRHLSFR